MFSEYICNEPWHLCGITCNVLAAKNTSPPTSPMKVLFNFQSTVKVSHPPWTPPYHLSQTWIPPQSSLSILPLSVSLPDTTHSHTSFRHIHYRQVCTFLLLQCQYPKPHWFLGQATPIAFQCALSLTVPSYNFNFKFHCKLLHFCSGVEFWSCPTSM